MKSWICFEMSKVFSKNNRFFRLQKYFWVTEEEKMTEQKNRVKNESLWDLVHRCWFFSFENMNFSADHTCKYKYLCWTSIIYFNTMTAFAPLIDWFDLIRIFRFSFFLFDLRISTKILTFFAFVSVLNWFSEPHRSVSATGTAAGLSHGLAWHWAPCWPPRRAAGPPPASGHWTCPTRRSTLPRDWERRNWNAKRPCMEREGKKVSVRNASKIRAQVSLHAVSRSMLGILLKCKPKKRKATRGRKKRLCHFFVCTSPCRDE